MEKHNHPHVLSISVGDNAGWNDWDCDVIALKKPCIKIHKELENSLACIRRFVQDKIYSAPAKKIIGNIEDQLTDSATRLKTTTDVKEIFEIGDFLFSARDLVKDLEKTIEDEGFGCDEAQTY